MSQPALDFWSKKSLALPRMSSRPGAGAGAATGAASASAVGAAKVARAKRSGRIAKERIVIYRENEYYWIRNE
jgi:hypothetical protein